MTIEQALTIASEPRTFAEVEAFFGTCETQPVHTFSQDTLAVSARIDGQWHRVTWERIFNTALGRVTVEQKSPRPGV